MRVGFGAFTCLGVSLALLVSSAQAQSPPVFVAADIVNAASGVAGPIAPGMLTVINGTSLTDIGLTQFCGPVLDLSCGSVQVLVNGRAAPVLSAKWSQITFQTPVDLSGSSATIQSTNRIGELSSAVVTVKVAPTAPGLYFPSPQSGTPLGSFFTQSGAVTSSNPVRPGDTVSILGTGFGASNPAGASGAPPVPGAALVAKVTATLSGQAIPIQASLPTWTTGPLPPYTSVGIVQIDLQVPAGASGSVPVVVNAGGVDSNTVKLPVLGIDGVANAGSGGAAATSGSWVTIYGAGLSATTRTWQDPDFSGDNLPTTLDAVRVKINGKSAFVYYISPAQINVQAPSDTTIGPVQVEVSSTTGTFSGTLTLQQYAPAFFPQGKYAASVFSVPGPAGPVYVVPVNYAGLNVPSRPAKSGETIMIFGTGFGPTTPMIAPGQVVRTPAPITDMTQLHVLVGGIPVTVQYAGMTNAGEFQLNVQLPALPDGDQPIVAEIGGASTQGGLFIPIKN